MIVIIIEDKSQNKIWITEKSGIPVLEALKN